jgi:sugar phosphate isomerase/epimerase
MITSALQSVDQSGRSNEPGSSPLISIGSWAFAFGPYETHPWSFESVCDYASRAGYDGVEINGFRPHPHPDDFVGGRGLGELRALVADRGLRVSGYAPDFRSLPPARVAPENYLLAIDRARIVCEALEIPVLRVDTVMPPQQFMSEDYERYISRLVAVWSEAARRCASSGTGLVWEFEPGFWLNRPSEIERVAGEIGSESFGILFDSSHAYTGGVIGARQGEQPELVDSVASYAERLLPFIRHLHLADADGKLHDEDTSVHVPLGGGQVDFPELLRALGPIAGRLKWWCVDLCYCDGADEKATAALAFARHLRDQIWPLGRPVL